MADYSFQLSTIQYEYLFIQFTTADGNHVGRGGDVNCPGAHFLVGVNAGKPQPIKIRASKIIKLCMYKLRVYKIRARAYKYQEPIQMTASN